MSVVYTAHAHVTGGREGSGETDDKRLSVTLSRPGGAGSGTNPEQLFAIGYAACFASAVGLVAGQKKLNTGAISLESEVTLNKDDKGYSLGVTLNLVLPSLDPAQAESLLREAHTVCHYSKALRGNVPIVLKANGKQVN